MFDGVDGGVVGGVDDGIGVEEGGVTTGCTYFVGVG